MRWTEETLTPAASAIAAPVQCVVSPGGASIVSATIRSAMSESSLGMRDGRVLSRRRPSKPSTAKRSCQRQTQRLDQQRNNHTVARASHSILMGLIFDDRGNRMTPTYAVKKGARYRYYVSSALRGGPGGAANAPG